MKRILFVILGRGTVAGVANEKFCLRLIQVHSRL